MKCVCLFESGRVVRLEEAAAAELVQLGRARYASKKEWRTYREEDRQDYAVSSILSDLRKGAA